jgi:hypothetical protein
MPTATTDTDATAMATMAHVPSGPPGSTFPPAGVLPPGAAHASALAAEVSFVVSPTGHKLQEDAAGR